MGIGVHNNLAMMNATRQYKINTGKKAKSSEKLSSGYRINRSADDAAGLQISEKMRMQIRGLNRGTANAQDGVSWVQTGDGALEEVHALLQRMRELTIQALNDTNTDADRAACQAEFDALQSEIDRITGTTQFNTQNIFDEHESPYYQCEGNVVWDQSQSHVITQGSNDLVLEYRTEETGAVKTATITVPPGIYTTQELMDEIDDVMIAEGYDAEGLVLEYTKDGTCNMNLEGGEILDSIGGGLSYLFYEMYEGGSFGALIGTTVFSNEYVELEVSNQNNHLEFTIENFNGTKNDVSINLPTGFYTRSEVIDLLNGELAGTDVTAVAYGTGIKLEGANSIVTGFKGNMFKIDDTGKVYHSVFYDNVKYGSVTMSSGYFTGGQIKSYADTQAEHQYFVIKDDNNKLTFTANGADAPTTIEIPQDSYTIDEMCSKLNDLFQAEGLELKASVHPTYTSDYYGIRIDSLVKGKDSAVGIDKTSSAFNTLFVTREYNYYGDKAVISKETTDDRVASVTGKKEFTGSNVPLSVVAGKNDKFTLTVDGVAYTITLDEGDYQAAATIAGKINTQLADPSIGLGDKIHATVSGSQVVLEAKDGSGIKKIAVSAIDSTNTGYQDIFVKTTISYDTTEVKNTAGSSSKPTVTLREQVSNPTVFDSTNNKLTVTFNNKPYDVILPEKEMTHDEIIAEIEAQLPKETVSTQNNTFQDVKATGTETTKSISISDNGSTSVSSKNFQNTGSADVDEGNVGAYENNIPAKITFDKALPSTFKVTDDCNKFQITINGVTETLTLTNGSYSPAAMATEIQKQIDKVYAQGEGANVSVDGNGRLVFTADLVDEHGNEKNGATTSITCGTGAANTFMRQLYTTETAASDTSDYNLLSNIIITEDTNTFIINYKDNGVSKKAELTLDTNTQGYSPTSFVNELNKKLQAGGHAVKASLNGSKLVLTTTDVGSDTSISYSSSAGGTSVEALFGPLVTEKPATGTANQTIQDEIVIGPDNNIFNVVVNKTAYSLNLKEKADGYSRDEFVDMLNEVFADNNVGLTATLSNNKITYTTDAIGKNASFEVTYAGGGNSMKAIYGESTVVSPGIEASFTSDGRLTLTGTQNGGSIAVKPAMGSTFLKPIENVKKEEPKPVDGFVSDKHASIDGVNTAEPIKINQYNNDLQFVYHQDGQTKNVSITIPDGEYNYVNDGVNDGIVEYLQTQIDNAVGSNQLEVSASDAGIVIRAVNAGSKYYMDSFAGNFYKKVLCSCEAKTATMSTSTSNGVQKGNLAYTVGRKDISNVTTKIKPGINDTLTLDLTYNGVSRELKITLDEGSYSGIALKKEIQEKLDEELESLGLSKGLIEAGIGGVNTGVSGSNDSNALVFRLSDTVPLPAEGEYIIDGVSGNAAFSIFYQTEGELDPAYVKGGKDISDGVVINPGETDLSFKVDGTEYTVTFTEKEYTAQELLDEINGQLTTLSAPVTAEMEDSVLKISYNQIGKHKITDVKGLAKDELFYSENGSTEPHWDVMIQLSSDVGNAFTIERPIVNTSFLKINSVAITKPKYADKALVRLDDAIARISEIRSTFGSEQNRLEHAIGNNENSYENTQAAESRIRDTDMALEMVEQSKNTILEQAALAMQTQTKHITEGILKLLQ